MHERDVATKLDLSDTSLVQSMLLVQSIPFKQSVHFAQPVGFLTSDILVITCEWRPQKFVSRHIKDPLITFGFWIPWHSYRVGHKKMAFEKCRKTLDDGCCLQSRKTFFTVFFGSLSSRERCTHNKYGYLSAHALKQNII